MVMTDAERQRKRREKLKQEAKKILYVRGDAGEFDERIRLALAVKSLADNKKLPEEIIELIIDESLKVFPRKDLITDKYIKKIMCTYLNHKKEV